ncbi:MAG TPA: wax ester/triacylglycerol synthase family O-acyltransferase [Acidimicrobiales bacterium]|nr:wax ester/triacylglycerol synthase family O-acyltransferase [Acidimicrobiales bacterium]
MEQLTGLDATFLYLETPSLHMHVSMAAVFDPSTVPGGYSFDKLRDLVSSRLALAPIFRRRLVEVPFRLSHPYWVDDPTFDIDYHIRRRALPAPGGMDEFAGLVGDVCSRQLDRTKPLWEMVIVEGLRDGRIGLVTKIHHSTIDGVSGAELLAQLFDLEADPAPRPAPAGPPAADERLPSDLRLVAHALGTRMTRPLDMTKLLWRTGRAVLDVWQVRTRGPGKAALPLTTPRTSLNAAITPHRRVAFSSIALEDVQGIKRACGTTVNDVVLALCAGALRRYLVEGDELPDDPLVATVPVSVAPAVPNHRGVNKVSAMFVALPCQIADPVERLLAIRDSTKGAKEEHNALGADVLLNWAEHATPNVFSAAARAYTRLKLADHHRPIHSLVISNVPGPGFPLYLAGAELVAGFPLGPVMDGAGLNVTVMSYRGTLNWGFMACAETVPRVAELAAAVPTALDELLASAALPPARPVGVAPARAWARTGRARKATRAPVEPTVEATGPDRSGA